MTTVSKEPGVSGLRPSPGGWRTALRLLLRGIRTYGFAVSMIAMLYLNSEAVVAMVAALQGAYPAEVVAENVLGVLPILLLLWATIRTGASVSLYFLEVLDLRNQADLWGIADGRLTERGES